MSTFKKFVRFGAKCPGAKCPWGILSWGILSLGQNVLGAKCPLANVCIFSMYTQLKRNWEQFHEFFRFFSKLTTKQRHVAETSRQTAKSNVLQITIKKCWWYKAMPWWVMLKIHFKKSWDYSREKKNKVQVYNYTLWSNLAQASQTAVVFVREQTALRGCHCITAHKTKHCKFR